MPRSRSKQPSFDSRDPLLDAEPDQVLDLHRFSASEATAAVRNVFVTLQRRKPGALLHIITGKGKGSANGPVLRGLVKGLLRGELHATVADYALDEDEGGYKVRLR